MNPSLPPSPSSDNAEAPLPADPAAPRTTAASSQAVVWCLACLVAVTGVAILAALLPARVRLLGLYLPAVGGLCGWLCRWLASQFDQRWSKSQTFVATLIIVVGLLLTTGLAQRRYRQQYEQEAPPPSVLALRQHPEFGLPLDGPPPYLQSRVSPLGRWQSPWPEVFWGAEVLVGTLLGGWLASRVAKV